MPSIMFHELVGYKFAKNNKKYDDELFYLGLIVPDAVNAYGFASKEKRWKAHFRDSNLDKWQENIFKFYYNNINNYENTYLMGYLIHVLTDIICDRIYQNKIYPMMLEKGYDKDKSYRLYEVGIKKFENCNINESWWEYVKSSFQKADRIEINNITEKMIGDWIDYIINNYGNRTYEKEDFIGEWFIDMVLNDIEIIM